MASGGINNKDKGGIVHRSSFRRFRCPHACHRGAFVIRGARSRNLGGHHGFCPCSRWWAQFRRLLMPPLSLFRFTGACYAASLDREASL